MTQSNVLVTLMNDQKEAVRKISIPTQNDQLSFKEVSECFPEAIGLKFLTDPIQDVYQKILTNYDRTKFLKPSTGWPYQVFVIPKHDESELVQLKNAMESGFEEIKADLKADLEAVKDTMVTKTDLEAAKKDLKDDIRAFTPLWWQVLSSAIMIPTLLLTLVGIIGTMYLIFKK